jgi:hypothetical protein
MPDTKKNLNKVFALKYDYSFIAIALIYYLCKTIIFAMTHSLYICLILYVLVCICSIYIQCI